jgi:hypothetical protein
MRNPTRNGLVMACPIPPGSPGACVPAPAHESTGASLDEAAISTKAGARNGLVLR